MGLFIWISEKLDSAFEKILLFTKKLGSRLCRSDIPCDRQRRADLPEKVNDEYQEISYNYSKQEDGCRIQRTR